MNKESKKYKNITLDDLAALTVGEISRVEQNIRKDMQKMEEKITKKIEDVADDVKDVKKELKTELSKRVDKFTHKDLEFRVERLEKKWA